MSEVISAIWLLVLPCLLQFPVFKLQQGNSGVQGDLWKFVSWSLSHLVLLTPRQCRCVQGAEATHSTTRHSGKRYEGHR